MDSTEQKNETIEEEVCRLRERRDGWMKQARKNAEAFRAMKVLYGNEKIRAEAETEGAIVERRLETIEVITKRRLFDEAISYIEMEKKVKQRWIWSLLGLALVGWFLLFAFVIHDVTASKSDVESIPQQVSYNLKSAEWANVSASPSWVRSTLLVRNVNRSCSGTVISIGSQSAAVLSAAHCFDGHINGIFEVSDHNGELYQAQLIAMNRGDDLALFQVPKKAARGVSCVPDRIASVGEFHKIGYTQGSGPKWARVTLTNKYDGDQTSFDVISGPFGSGDSGGTIVFCPGDPPNYDHGQLVSVISAGDGDIQNGRGYEIVGANLIAINRFLDVHWSKLDYAGKRRKRCPD